MTNKETKVVIELTPAFIVHPDDPVEVEIDSQTKKIISDSDTILIIEDDPTRILL